MQNFFQMEFKCFFYEIEKIAQRQEALTPNVFNIHFQLAAVYSRQRVLDSACVQTSAKKNVSFWFKIAGSLSANPEYDGAV